MRSRHDSVHGPGIVRMPIRAVPARGAGELRWHNRSRDSKARRIPSSCSRMFADHVLPAVLKACLASSSVSGRKRGVAGWPIRNERLAFIRRVRNDVDSYSHQPRRFSTIDDQNCTQRIVFHTIETFLRGKKDKRHAVSLLDKSDWLSR